MNMKLQKQIYIGNNLRELLAANKTAYKKHRNKYFKVRKKRIKTYMNKVSL